MPFPDETESKMIQLVSRAERAEARIDELSRTYAVQGLAIEELTSERDEARARVAELEEGISTAMQLIEGGFDSAAYEALEALNAHK